MSPKYTLETLTKKAHCIMGSDPPYSKEEVNDIVGVILSFAINNINFSLAEALCEKFIKSNIEELQVIAITSVAHIARIYRRQVSLNIMEEIYRIYKDPMHKYWGTANDTLDELKFFLKIRKPKIRKLSKKFE